MALSPSTEITSVKVGEELHGSDANLAEENGWINNNSHYMERCQWVLNAPEPPSPWFVIKKTLRKSRQRFLRLFSHDHSKGAAFACFFTALQAIFPVLQWVQTYTFSQFKSDLLAGLTLTSVSIPESIGYASLVKLDPQYGLYTSAVPPLIYAFMGSSRHIAIGPVAVVSLLLASLAQEVEDPVANPVAYRKLVLSATFFGGVFQTVFGLCRLGFLVDFLSHAAIAGFMAGAAIVIGLQQLKSLLGITNFTNKTDIISVIGAIWRSMHHSWKPHNFIIGCSFLIFILTMNILGRRYKKYFWLPAIAPFVSVILSTVIVYLTRADKHGTDIVGHINGGVNPLSVHQLQLNSSHSLQAAKIGLIVSVVGVTGTVALGRALASQKGYHIEGNKEMVAFGFINIIGSLTSCYVATGSFSLTAVNVSSGCETAMSNIMLGITTLMALKFFTSLLYYTPVAILPAVILSVLPGLVDLKKVWNVWRIDKLDFLACTGAFLGVLFVSVEVGLLTAVIISFAKIILISIHPGIELLGRLPGTQIFYNVHQYPMAVKSSEALIIGIKSAFLCFANANSIRQGIIRRVIQEEEKTQGKIRSVILDLSSLTNIDTSGITSLEELQKEFHSTCKELLICNPRWEVIHKLKVAKFVERIGGRVFLTVTEAVDSCLGS